MAIACKKGAEERAGKIPVMEKILLFIKHNLVFVWNIIEKSNDILFSYLFRPELERVLPQVFIDFTKGPFEYRVLHHNDAERLQDLINNQAETDLEYFRPHPFDRDSIIRQLRKSSFLMMGTFDGDRLTGYFFLRFFANRKCFVGRLIDKEHRGQGIGKIMNAIMYNIAWRLKFRCLSTISKNNQLVIKAHSLNKHMIILKELKNDYLLVEFLPDKIQ